MHLQHKLLLQCLMIFLIGMSILGCQSKGPENLLLNKRPTNYQSTNLSNITDGKEAREGEQWNSKDASILNRDAVLIYDLGQSYPIDTLVLQADNNDVYEVAASDDNDRYRSVWRTSTYNRGGGLQTRHMSSLNIQARYLKLSIAHGDGAYSISEFSAYSTTPDDLPKTVSQRPSLGADETVKSAMLYFGLSLALFLYFAYRGAPKAWLAISALLPLAGLYELITTLYQYWPPYPTHVSLFRGILAGVAAIAISRELFSHKLLPASLASTYIVLTLTATLSFFTFYNLGHPQFMHGKKGTWTYIHFLDLRQYYPTAKYFPEVGYHDIYVADIAAYLEDHPRKTIESIGHYAMRDLHSNQMKRVRDYAKEVSLVKAKFSSERWEEYKKDARYIRSLMSDHQYFRYLVDYGGNATPVWISQLYLLFNAFEISDTYALILASLDPILLLLMFFCIWRSFGMITMSVSMVVFGANDFIMYGTNWGGAILRHDWMFYTGFGFCALKTNRWMLGGALIGAGAMVRAFPFFAYCGIAMLTIWWLWGHLRSTRRLPTLKECIDGNLPVLKVALGAVLTALVLYLLSSLLLSFEAWGIWWNKIHGQQSGALANHMGLRSLIAGWDANQQSILQSRQLLHLTCIAVMIGLMFFAIRNRSVVNAGILGMFLMWIIYYPQNYYIHFIIFLPLLVDSSKISEYKPLSLHAVGIYLSVLILCMFQYVPTFVKSDLGLHFYFSNVFLAACLLSTLLILVKSRPPNRNTF